MALVPFFNQKIVKGKNQINKLLSLQVLNPISHRNKFMLTETSNTLRSKLTSTFKYINFGKLKLIKSDIGYNLVFPYTLKAKTIRKYGIFFTGKSHYQVSLFKKNKTLYVNLIDISYTFSSYVAIVFKILFIYILEEGRNVRNIKNLE